MKRTCVLAAVLGMTAMGLAQDQTPTNIAFRLGFGYPFDDATRRITKNMIGVGVDIFLTEEWLKGSETFFSVDWFGKSGSGAKGNFFPIMVNQRWYTNSMSNWGGRTYFHVGLGIAVIDITSTKTTIGGRAGFGVEFGPNLFGEANVVFSDEANGAKANALGVYIGYRF